MASAHSSALDVQLLQLCVCHSCTYVRTTVNSGVFVISVRTCVLLSTVVCLSFLYVLAYYFQQLCVCHSCNYVQLSTVVCLSFLYNCEETIQHSGVILSPVLIWRGRTFKDGRNVLPNPQNLRHVLTGNVDRW